MKKAKKTKAKCLKWYVTAFFSLVIAVGMVVANYYTTVYEQVINIALKTETTRIETDPNDTTDTQYFKSVYSSKQETKAAGKAVAERLTEEGAVLLKNEGEALPIASTAKISLFGHSSANMIVCGTGSADIDASEAPTFKEALESRGVEVNPSLWNFYVDNIDTYATNPKKGDNSIRDGSDGVTKGEYTVNEIPWDVYTAAAKSEFSAYDDAAIVVFSRLGGEMYDLPADTAHQGNTTETVNGSGNSLELTIQERDLLKQIQAAGFEKTIVLLNSTNAMECDFVDDPELGVDACMWIGYTGVVGLYGVSDLLVGNAKPSGRLVDTYCVDNTTSPAHVNIYGAKWTNYDQGDPTFYGHTVGLDGNTHYNVYQEGIYVGYRYYETRYEDYVLNQGNHGDYDYTKDVKYPFGYGLTYTTFEYSEFSVKENEDSFDVTVTVTNTGDTASKEVVEVYFQSPYTDYDKQYGIEKAAIELCGFAKTKELAPDEPQTVTINVPKKELRAYDSYNAKTYILDKGDYYFTVGRDAHDALNNVLTAKVADVSRMTAEGNADFVDIWNNPTLDTTTYSVSNDGEENYKITNQLEEGDLNLFDNGDQAITYLSRNDWTGTFPKTTVALELTEAMKAEMTGLKKYEKLPATHDELPTMGAPKTMKLAQMIGKDFDDPAWETLLDQVTYEEMALLIGIGYHGTRSVASVDKPATVDENGPQGFTQKLTDVFGNSEPMTAYSDENIMAATWNVELMEEMGEALGEDGLALGMSGLYGPAMNTHRSPYSGRNFEYYSEDGFLAGKIAAAETKGIQSKGVYVYLKHFALNDSETFCRCYSIFANEQTIREVYLEPFEHAVVEGGAMNVMNSFGRVGIVWTGAHKGLMTNILRGEWGMRGFALTDFSNSGKTYDVKLGVLAGTDSWDCSIRGSGSWSDKLLKWEAEKDIELTWAMREATHRILYTVANSNAMNGISPSSRLVDVIPWWRATIYAVFVVGVVGFVASLIMVLVTKKKAKKQAKKASKGYSNKNYRRAR